MTVTGARIHLIYNLHIILYDVVKALAGAMVPFMVEPMAPYMTPYISPSTRKESTREGRACMVPYVLP